MLFRTLIKEDIPAAVELLNLVFGDNYYSEEDIELNPANIVAIDEHNDMAGVRVCSIDLEAQTAHYKSIAIRPDMRGQSIGPEMAWMAEQKLKRLGINKAIAWSWIESPHSSSVRYLLKIGFKPIGFLKHPWAEEDYFCTGCKQKPCVCNALVMEKNLEG